MAAAFDAATSAEEEAGDGTISLSHTAGGSSERAIFAGVGASVNSGVRHSNTLTYGGSGMTEDWDAFDNATTGNLCSGYHLAIGGTLTGSQTVTNALTGAGGTLDYHTLAVVSFTGVDQTTTVGTPQFNAEDTPDTSSPVNHTVTGLAAGDIVVDHLMPLCTGTPAKENAAQTERTSQNSGDAVKFMRVSTREDGSGAMGWTMTGLVGAMHGAIAFKASAGAAAGAVRARRMTKCGVG